MRLTYDPRYNIAYLRLRPKRKNLETIQLSDDLNIDLAPDGTVYGIEFLNANDQLARVDGGKILVLNEATGRRQEVSVSGSSARRSST